MMEKIKKTNSEKYVSQIKCFFAALLSAASFFVTLDTPEPYTSHISRSLLDHIFKFFEYVGSSFAGVSFYILVLAVALSYIYYHFFGNTSHRLEAVKGDKGIAIFFAIIYTGGRAFAYNDFLNALWTPKFNILKALVLIGGCYYLYLLGIRLLNTLFIKRHEIRINCSVNKFSKIKKLYHAYPFLFILAFIMLMWLPHLIFRYPGALSTDNWNQLNDYFGWQQFSTAQPIIHTIAVGSFVEFGLKVLGSANAGLFIYCILQALLMAAVLSYTHLFMYKWNSPKWFRILALFTYTVTPYYTGNAAWAIKDYPHLIGYVLWGLCFIEIILEGKKSFTLKEDKRLIILWILGAILMAAFRKNGMHIYIIASLVLLVIFIKELIKKNAKLSVSVVVALLLPIVVVTVMEKTIINVWDVYEIDQKDAFSLPFQQTARYYHYYGDEMTEEELAAVGDVLNLNELYEDYTPHCSDNVKSEYHAEGTEQLIRYFKVWFLMFFKHPDAYIEATWDQNYYIFMPDFDNVVYNQDCNAGNAVAGDGLIEYLNIHVPDSMQGFPILICSMYRALNKMPIISSLNNLCLYVLMMFVLTLFMKRNGLKKYNLSMLPIWLSLLFIILAPMVKDQPRYSWAIIYLMPTYVAMYMRLLDKNG